MTLFDPPELRSERLALTPIQACDALVVQRVFVDDPRVTQFVAWNPLTDSLLAQRFVEREARAWQDGEDCRGWLARLSDSGEVVGFIIARRHHDRSAEFSYVVTRAHWNRGYATEIVRTLLARAGQDRSLLQVWAVCDAENVASRRVLEKAGMSFDRLLPRHQKHNVAAEPRDCIRFTLHLDERRRPA